MTETHQIAGRYDAIVVGARCAGASCALLLARTGLNVLAIDRQARGADTLSTHALMRGGVVQLARWSLLGEIAAAGTPAVRHTTFRYGDEAIAIDIKPDHGVDALYAPRRTVLDRVLADAAGSAGAQVVHGAAMTALEFGPGGRVAGAAITGPNGSPQSVEAGIVIGADGRNSALARMVGARIYRTSRFATAAIYGYHTGLADRGFRWFYGPGVSVGAIPTNDGATCVFISVPPERFRRGLAAGAEAMFESILAETAPDFAAEVAAGARVGGLRGFPGEHGFFRQAHGPGWALVGDAGYFKDPLTAHGITDALRDGDLLARAIVEGGAPALARYQAERDALSNDLFEVTDDIASFDWTLGEVKDHHQRLNRAMKAETAAIADFGPAAALAA